MTAPLTDAALSQLFLDARTHNAWQNKLVPEALLRQAWDLACMGPTSVNCQPMRVVFVVSEAAKARLKPALALGNVDKTMAAPVTAIIGHDMEFHQHLPRFFPHADARSWFVGNQSLTESTAQRNGTLQGAYLILACRALGLDCGPMSGFDAAQVDAAFFADTTVKSNFLLNIGYGDAAGLYPRGPRLGFDEGASLA